MIQFPKTDYYGRYFVAGFGCMGIVALMLSMCSKGHADTLSIGTQYGLPSGFSSRWGVTCQVVTADGYVPCVQIPHFKSVRQCTGTVTIKVPNVELLHRIVCGVPGRTETIWQAEFIGPMTLPITTPVLPSDNLLLGPNSCWTEFQAANNGPATPDGGGFEVQAICATN
jgi:hypothetical protein